MRLQRRFLPIVISAVAIIGATPLFGEEFYESQLRLGRTAILAGKPLEAAELCRIASFGLMDAPPRLIESVVCIALASTASGRDGDVPAALERFMEVEARFPSYRNAAIDDTFRRSFDALLQEKIDIERLAAIPSLASLAVAPQPKPSARRQRKERAEGAEARIEKPAVSPKPDEPKAARRRRGAKPEPPPEQPPEVAVQFEEPPAVAEAPAEATPQPKPITTPVSETRTPAPRRQETKPEPAPERKVEVSTPVEETPVAAPKPEAPRSEPVQSLVRRPAGVEDSILREGRRLIRARRLGPAEKLLYAELTKQPERRDLRLALLEAATLYGDWSTAAAQTDLLKPFGDGEETALFYAAVALYESGRIDEAKRYLAMAKPQIRVRPYVRFYVERIEGD